jgi:hypothetical protein
MLTTPEGLWIGSDTEWIGDREYLRKRIAFFPFAGGSEIASTATPTLPADVYLARADGSLWRTRFTGTSTSEPVQVQASGWKDTRGGYVVGDRLYTGSTSKMISVRSAGPSGLGEPTDVDPYDDPAWRDVPTGSGQTYLGFPPQLYDQLGAVTSMAYHDGRLYYTLKGKPRLQWRTFLPDSGVIGTKVDVTGFDRSWRATKGMFVIGDDAFVVDGKSGDLVRYAIGADGPAGAGTVVNSQADGGIDWRGLAVFAVDVA